MNSRIIKSLIVFGVIGAAVLVTIIGTTAAPPSGFSPADAPKGVLTGQNVIHRDMSGQPPLPNSRMVIIQGSKDDNGLCHNRVEFSAARGDTRIQESRLVAVDPTTCRFQVEYGNPITVPQLPSNASSGSTSLPEGN